MAEHIIFGLGGKSNIKHVDACFTRLRVEVKDVSDVDEDGLKALGVSGVVKIGNNIQAVFGGYSDIYKNEINALLQEENIEDIENIENITISAPVAGKIIDIEEVPDSVFAEKMAGDGVAIIPTKNVICAPCDGVIKSIFPTNHAFGIQTKEGIEVLVHIGIGTVELEGKGFKRLIKAGQKVKKGTPIIEVDFEYIKKQGKEIITPVVITNMDKVKNIKKNINDKNKIMEIHADFKALCNETN